MVSELQRVYRGANQHFAEIAHLAKVDEIVNRRTVNRRTVNWQNREPGEQRTVGRKMKGFERDNLWFSLCGLNCGLCPMKMDGHCPGCGGGEGNQSCKIARCSIQHGGIEYCNQCTDFPCDKYGRQDEYDIFITHRNWKRDFEKMEEMGAESYNSEQGQKLEILRSLIENYNDGRRKSFFCLAVNLLDLEDLKTVMGNIEREYPLEKPSWEERTTDKEQSELKEISACKERAAFAVKQFQSLAEQRGVELKWHRKPNK